MANPMEMTSSLAPGGLERVTALLGGDRVLQHRIRTSLDAHELLLQGLPSPALGHLVGHLTVLGRTDSLEKAIGMSLRTFQRRKDTPSKLLNPEQSGRTWKFAELLAKATALFGSQDEAELWFERAAFGLDGRRPIDLLTTTAGVELVEDLLDRLAYGVYV